MDFDNIYLEYFKPIYQFCYRIVGDADLARDKTQETFVKLLEKFNTKNKPSNAKAWLYRVAMNSCRDCLRKKVNFQNVI